MADNSDTPEAAEVSDTTSPAPEAADAMSTTLAPDPDAPEATEADGSELAREARGWRKKYQAARAEAEESATRVGALQRQLVEHHIAGQVADVDDWWSAVTLADLINADSTVSTERVAAKLTEVIAAKPHWAPRRPASTPASAVTSAHDPGGAGESSSWATLLGGQRTR